MLLGTYFVRFSVKHRVAVPSSFRKELGETLILAKWYESCLVLVGRELWDALWKRLTGGLKIPILPIRDTERFILASAYELVPDEQGRIVIPEILSGYAGLGEEVVFIGLGDRVEIWGKEAWETKERQVAKEAASYIESLATRRKRNGGD